MAGFNSLKQIFQKERTERQFGLHPDFFFFSCLPYSVSEPLQPTFTEKRHRETGSRRSRCWVTFSIRHPMLLPAQPRVCDPLEACPGSPEVFLLCVSGTTQTWRLPRGQADGTHERNKRSNGNVSGYPITIRFKHKWASSSVQNTVLALRIRV